MKPATSKKTLSCRLLLAVNYIDEARYDDAEQLFNESIKITDRINDNNLLCHAYYNFGFLKTAQKKDKEALPFTKGIGQSAFRERVSRFLPALCIRSGQSTF